LVRSLHLGAAAIAAVLALTSCGSDHDARDVRRTVDRFGAATARKDYATLCRDLLSRQIVSRLAAIGLPCTVALERALGDVQQPRVRVRAVSVKGNTALARVDSGAAGQAPSTDTIRLVRQGDSWRIASLSSEVPGGRRPGRDGGAGATRTTRSATPLRPG
jgi:hypothetical protein